MRRLLLILVFFVVVFVIDLTRIAAQTFPPLPREVSLRWEKNLSGRLIISAPVNQELLDSCLASGLEYRFKFIIKICRRRTLWFHACSDEIAKITSVHRDPVTETYLIARDTLGDNNDPDLNSYTDYESAVGAARQLAGLTPAELSGGDQKILASQRSYLSARVLTDCKGDYNRTLARLSNILTLGMAQVGWEDTGWFDFDLKQ